MPATDQTPPERYAEFGRILRVLLTAHRRDGRDHRLAAMIEVTARSFDVLAGYSTAADVAVGSRWTVGRLVDGLLAWRPAAVEALEQANVDPAMAEVLGWLHTIVRRDRAKNRGKTRKQLDAEVLREIDTAPCREVAVQAAVVEHKVSRATLYRRLAEYRAATVTT